MKATRLSVPFVDHPHFIEPQTPQATIWRYMDLARFLSLLERSSLYFPRLDKLRESDPFEGYYTKANVRFSDIKYSDVPPEILKANNIESEVIFNVMMQANRRSLDMSKMMRETCFVNSWHVLDYESAAMWAQYVPGGAGIAIRSSYERLLRALGSAEDPIHIGLIRYIDYEREGIPTGQLFFR